MKTAFVVFLVLLGTACLVGMDFVPEPWQKGQLALAAGQCMLASVVFGKK